MSAATTDDLMTPEDLAKHWHVTTRTLQNYRADGFGPQFLVLGKQTVRYRRKDVVAFDERNLTGGQIPSRAHSAMKRAAQVLDIVATWKMRESTLVTIEAMRDELRALVREGA